MKNWFKLPVIFELKEHSDQRILSVDFGTYPIDEYCLGLCLLKERLIDTLIITNEQAVFKLKISVDNTLTSQARPQVHFSKNDVHVSISANELDYWIIFFLTYYRDGVSSVDHIDVDAVSLHDTITDVYIIFKVSHILQSLSADEARRRLGL